jgi:hypothetical protein
MLEPPIRGKEISPFPGAHAIPTLVGCLASGGCMMNTIKKRKTGSAIFNLVVGGLFILAGFNILTGAQGINYMYLLIGALFLLRGILDLRK